MEAEAINLILFFAKLAVVLVATFFVGRYIYE